ncbi:MAG: acyl carrier protein [Candidatus Devosia phytovorans]|uniref:Acyl carrier protein n=1 Tax=Candidatus Devosia phytovorans TaxID=3121372 RepID=A0AAJ6AYL2_9HYPH|nr:acyl carrier protein [Devosia sp.]WEK03710.1 MAG: acyl carrier protein [Devosia sp.]
MATKTEFTADELRDYLQTELSIEQALDDDTELFSTGLLDSVSMMSVIMFIEQRSGGEVRPADVTLDNFDTIGRIVAYAATLD